MDFCKFFQKYAHKRNAKSIKNFRPFWKLFQVLDSSQWRRNIWRLFWFSKFALFPDSRRPWTTKLTSFLTPEQEKDYRGIIFLTAWYLTNQYEPTTKQSKKSARRCVTTVQKLLHLTSFQFRSDITSDSFRPTFQRSALARNFLIPL